MLEDHEELGRLISVHTVAPIYIQRAIFIAVLSFLFFLAMMFAFYLRQSFVYFMLATAFMAIYLITMFSWFKHRNSTVKVFENGLGYKSNVLSWKEIESISNNSPIVVKFKTGKTVVLPSTIMGSDALIRYVELRLSA